MQIKSNLLVFFTVTIGACATLAAPGTDETPLPDGIVNSRTEVADRNLLTNGNFAKGIAGWQILNWGKNGTMEVDTRELHDGRPTLRIDNVEACHSFVRQILKAKPHTRYRLTGYIKTKDVEPANAAEKTGAILMVGRKSVYTPLLKGTNSWTEVSVEFVTEHDPEIRVDPSLGSDYGFVSGTAWFSDLQLTEIGEDQPANPDHVEETSKPAQ